MKRAGWILGVVTLVVVLTVPAAGAAVTYAQAGYDAGRTGAVPFELPRANDTAFELQLPGTPTGTVAVDGRTAHVVTLDHGIEVDNETLDENALWSIDLDTVEVTKRFEVFDERPAWSTAFTDGERVYTQVERTVTAYDLDGEELWTWEVPRRLPEADHVTCFDDPAFRAGTMYLACLEVRERSAGTDAGVQEAEEVPHTGLVLGALEASTGEERWRWFETADTNPGSQYANGVEEDAPSETWDTLNAEVTATRERVFIYSLVYSRDRVYTTATSPLGEETGPETYTRWFQVTGLNADGGYEILRQGETDAVNRRNYPSGGADGQSRFERALDGKVVATSTSAFVEWNVGDRGPEAILDAFNPTDGASMWEAELPAANTIERIGSHAIGIREDTIVAASPRALTSLQDPGEPTWEQRIPPGSPTTFGTSPLLLDGETVVVETLRHEPDDLGSPRLNGSGYGLQALDLATGDVLWDHGFHTPVGDPGDRFTGAPTWQERWLHSSTPGFGSGVVVGAAPDGHVEVLGETSVSMAGPEVDQERFPPVGENVTLDLSDTEPGAFGPATRYRVDWGDGTVDGWQDSPTFRHAYDEPGNHTARLMVGNDANQTAITFVTMRVGQTEPNFIETAFKQENQEMTFGILGIAMALGGGLIGVARRYRERSRLQEELDAIDALFEETKHRPAECEAQLTERKAHARGLLTDGYLTEEQFGVIENRIEELKRELRLGAVEQEFAFLPYSLVTALREMLEDGRVTRMEKDGFLTALQADEMIHPEQKALVRERIEQWFARDAGGRSPRGGEADDA